MSIVIIDYGMGNVFSVQNALSVLGAKSIISKKPEDIASSDRIILPGVGAFPDGMKNLKASVLVGVLEREILEKKKPFLGICLGMQLLASLGKEYKETKGLNWIPGTVRRFEVDEKKFRIPHVGWNDIVPKENSILFSGITNPVFYFVHSFHFVPEDPLVIAARCDYGETFVVSVQKDNIFGTQFHPEKSQKSGFAVLKNFLNYK